MNTEKLTLLNYLADAAKNKQDIPSIAELSNILDISTASVREQLEVARQLGFVEVKPRTGIQSKAFSLVPMLELGLSYGLRNEPKLLEDYVDLRNHLELSYWDSAVKVLDEDQLDYMQFLVDIAFRKLQRKPAIIPDEEESEFHLTLYRPLANKVLINMLEVYWKLANRIGEKLFSDLDDMLSAWSQRQAIVDALCEKNTNKGRNALVSLLGNPGKPKDAEITQSFE